MNENRLADLSRWRDGQLFKRYGDEAAAFRLRDYGTDEALQIEAPTSEEMKWTDTNGEPIDPDDSWWGYNGMSAVEIRARREGKWPPG